MICNKSELAITVFLTFTNILIVSTSNLLFCYSFLFSFWRFGSILAFPVFWNLILNFQKYLLAALALSQPIFQVLCSGVS